MHRFLLQRPWMVIGVVALAVLVAVVIRGRHQPHSVRAVFDAAVNLQSGLDVQVDGVDVGKVKDVEYRDGHAIVELGISDDKVWPLRQGTTAAIRFGTTAGNGTRLVAVTPGPARAPEIPENGVIGEARTITPVEFDQVFNTLNASTRRRLRSMLQGSATALEGHEAQMRSGLKEIPGGLRSTGDLFGDLVADEAALRGFVANGDRVTSTLAARRPVISDLVTVAARTFGAFGERSDRVRASLDRFAPMLADTRSTLARADTSLDKIDRMLTALAPGARELPSMARSASGALVRLERVAPPTVATLETARAMAPRVTSLLDAGTPFMPPATKALRTLAPMLDCVRPYTPEVAGMFGTWGGWAKNYDQQAHYARIRIRQGATSVNGLLPSAEAATKLPASGTRYAMPRPPGLNAGKPSFLPQCGITEDALNPAKDPERRG